MSAPIAARGGTCCQDQTVHSSSRGWVAVLGAALIVSVLAACTPTGEAGPSQPPSPSPAQVTSTPSAPSNDGSASNAYRDSRWPGAITEFPYEMPAGYEFPAEAPESGFAMSTSSGDDVAYAWWGCAVLLSAWSAVDAGDAAQADQLLARVNEAMAERPGMFPGWSAPLSLDWQDPVFREAGESGLCAAWFEREESAED
jgi:hypothetical protein